MKRFFINLIKTSIVAISFVLIIILILAYNRKPLGNFLFTLNNNVEFTYAKIHELESGIYQNVDILICGSSHAFRDIDTRCFTLHGISCFNLGTANQSPTQTLYLLRKYLNLLNPKLILFEVYPGTLFSNGAESTCDLISNNIIDKELIQMAFDIKSINCYTTLLGSLIYDKFIGKYNLIPKVIGQNNIYVSGGYVEHQSIDDNLGKSLNSPKHNIVFNKKSLDYFDKCLEDLKNKNISYILIESPTTKVDFEAMQNHAEFERLMRKKGLYINYNNNIQLDDTVHFYDNNHLNKLGVEIFTNKLINDLIENKEIHNVIFSRR